jgi:hypothetical protein
VDEYGISSSLSFEPSRISSAVGDNEIILNADERECARVCRLCVAKQMSDDFCGEEPSLSLSCGMNSTVQSQSI